MCMSLGRPCTDIFYRYLYSMYQAVEATMTLGYRWTRGEPDLSEVLHDDVVQVMMRRDGVSTQELGALIQRVQRRLHAPASGRPAAPKAGEPRQVS
jgi:hypothetical protein